MTYLVGILNDKVFAIVSDNESDNRIRVMFSYYGSSSRNGVHAEIYNPSMETVPQFNVKVMMVDGYDTLNELKINEGSVVTSTDNVIFEGTFNLLLDDLNMEIYNVPNNSTVLYFRKLHRFNNQIELCGISFNRDC